MASFDELLLAAVLPHACSISQRQEGARMSGPSYSYGSEVFDAQPVDTEAETRVDVDGKRYTEAQFYNYYGAHAKVKWAEAKGSSSVLRGKAGATVPSTAASTDRTVRWGQAELRVDQADGNLYTRDDFLSFYGNLEAWDRAVRTSSDANQGDEEEERGEDDGDLMLSEEMLEILYRQRIRRAKKRSKREQRDAERAFAESSGAVLGASTNFPVGRCKMKVSMLEAELNGKWDEALDSIGYEVHAWPIAPLNS